VVGISFLQTPFGTLFKKRRYQRLYEKYKLRKIKFARHYKRPTCNEGKDGRRNYSSMHIQPRC